MKNEKEKAQGKSGSRQRPLGSPVCSLGLCAPGDGESYTALTFRLLGLPVLI